MVQPETGSAVRVLPYCNVQEQMHLCRFRTLVLSADYSCNAQVARLNHALSCILLKAAPSDAVQFQKRRATVEYT